VILGLDSLFTGVSLRATALSDVYRDGRREQVAIYSSLRIQKS
jgi:hypothetical protein